MIKHSFDVELRWIREFALRDKKGNRLSDAPLSYTVFIQLNARSFFKLLAFPMRRLFKGGVYFEITFLNHRQQLLKIVCKYYVI